MTIWKNNSFWSPNEKKKNHKTIKEGWINGWNRRKKNHIDFIHHFITSKIFTLSTILQFWKSENYLKRRSKTQEKSNKIHFEDSSRRAKYWRIQERWKKKKEKFHNLCQPISNWKLIKWRQKSGKTGYFKLTTGNNL